MYQWNKLKHFPRYHFDHYYDIFQNIAPSFYINSQALYYFLLYILNRCLQDLEYSICYFTLCGKDTFPKSSTFLLIDLKKIARFDCEEH